MVQRNSIAIREYIGNILFSKSCKDINIADDRGRPRYIYEVGYDKPVASQSSAWEVAESFAIMRGYAYLNIRLYAPNSCFIFS